MARDHLANRANWQKLSAARGHGAEDAFSVIMQMHLSETQLTATHKPKDLKSIYGKRRGPDGKTRPHGVEPEFAVRNKKTGKAIYVEVKRQRAAGNAHERACKFLMPGIVRSAREVAKQSEDVLPFWLIFTNGIAKDENYRREIEHWFQGIEPHFLLWKNIRDYDAITGHFDKYIRPLLD